MTKRERREARKAAQLAEQARLEAEKKAREQAAAEEPEIVYNNEIAPIRTLKGLERVNLDFDSPRLRQAMDDLGVSEAEL